MKREEAIKQIRKRVSMERDYKQQFYAIVEALERLEQPLTLADFLGWEEGIEYRRGGNILKVEDNHLLDKRPNGKFYNTNCSTAELIDLRNATKYEPLYYAKIKGWSNPKLRELQIYWNCYGEEGEVMVTIGGAHEDGTFRTKFTKAQWAELGINEANADFGQVEE